MAQLNPMYVADIDDEPVALPAKRPAANLESLPDLQPRFVQYQQQLIELHKLYDPVLEEPLPERMLALLQAKGQASKS